MRPRQSLSLLIVAASCSPSSAFTEDQPDGSASRTIAVAPAAPPSGIADAAREGYFGAAWKGPAPQPLPGAVRLKPVRNSGRSSIPKAVRDQLQAQPSGVQPSGVRPDGQRGFVEILPPPPEYDQQSPTRESRYFELPPAPES